MSGLLSQIPRLSDVGTGWPWTEQVCPTAYAGDRKWPKISIVTPSFNQGQFIEETIRSVLLQNYPNLQYIVIDGGSTDDTVSILEKYTPWINYWVSEPDTGQSNAINKGLTHCDGEWFNWINSDDVLLPKALYSIGMIADSDVHVVAGRLHYDTPQSDLQGFGCLKVTGCPEDCIINHRMCQPSTFYRRTIVEQLQGVREKFHYIMDVDLWARYLGRFGIDHAVTIEADIARFREHEQSKTVAKGIAEFDQEERILLRELGESLGVDHRYLDQLTSPQQRTHALELCLSRETFIELIACRYIWSEAESAWRARNYKELSRLVSHFRENRIPAFTFRHRALSIVAMMPEWLLRAAERCRATS